MKKDRRPVCYVRYSSHHPMCTSARPLEGWENVASYDVPYGTKVRLSGHPQNRGVRASSPPFRKVVEARGKSSYPFAELHLRGRSSYALRRVIRMLSLFTSNLEVCTEASARQQMTTPLSAYALPLRVDSRGAYGGVRPATNGTLSLSPPGRPTTFATLASRGSGSAI